MKIKEVPSLSLGARNRKNPKRSGRPVPKARKCSWTAGQLNSSVSGELCWGGPARKNIHRLQGWPENSIYLVIDRLLMDKKVLFKHRKILYWAICQLMLFLVQPKRGFVSHPGNMSHLIVRQTCKPKHYKVTNFINKYKEIDFKFE